MLENEFPKISNGIFIFSKVWSYTIRMKKKTTKYKSIYKKNVKFFNNFFKNSPLKERWFKHTSISKR